MQLNLVRAFSVGPGARNKASNAALPESGGAPVKQEYVFVMLFFFSALNTLYLWLCKCFSILIGIWLDLISVQTSFLFWSFCGCIPDENEEE